MAAPQEEDDPMNQDSAPSILRSLHFAHGAFLSNVQATLTKPPSDINFNSDIPIFGTSREPW